MKRVILAMVLALAWSVAFASSFSESATCRVYINTCVQNIKVAIYSWANCYKPFGPQVERKRFTMGIHQKYKLCYPQWLVAIAYPHCIARRFPLNLKHKIYHYFDDLDEKSNYSAGKVYKIR